MIAGFFNTVGYAGPWASNEWPMPPCLCARQAAGITMQRAMEQASLADELGFDWISVSEHHYSPRILTPSPMIFAAGMTQRIKRAKIAILGPLLPRVTGLDVVDLGCGTGRWLHALIGSGPRSLLGVDPSPEMLAQAKAKLGEQAAFICGPCTDF